MSEACIWSNLWMGWRSMIVDDGSAPRWPAAPAESSMAASPKAVPTQTVWILGLTYIMTS